jgi:predicted transglutaminase-like cysteine proteinase
MKYIFALLIFVNLLNADAFSINKKDIKRIKKQYTKKQTIQRIYNFNQFFKNTMKYNDIAKLNRVNTYINKIIGKADQTNEWITPKEFLIRGRGDCEDYAITKYFALKKLKLDTNKLFLSIVKVKGSKNYHMVLLYINNNEILVLDNLSWKILTLKKRKDLIFYYAFNKYGSYIIKNNKLKKERHIRRGEVDYFKNIIKDIKEGK